MIHTAPVGIIQVLIRPFINFAVATFLFLSGYLTKFSVAENIKQMYSKRIMRVIIPYLIWSILYCVIYHKIDKLLLNIFTAQANGAMYYIFVYVQFVLLTPALIRLAQSTKMRWLGWIVAPVSIVIVKYIPALIGYQVSPFISLVWGFSCLGWFVFYYLGLLLGNDLIDLQINLKILVLIYVLSLLIQMVEGYAWFLMGDVNCGSQLKLSSLISSILFILIVYRYLKDNKYHAYRIFLGIGDASFGIYLSHMMFIIVLSHISLYNRLPFILNSALILLSSYVCVLIGRKVCGERICRWFGFK